MVHMILWRTALSKSRHLENYILMMKKKIPYFPYIMIKYYKYRQPPKTDYKVNVTASSSITHIPPRNHIP